MRHIRLIKIWSSLGALGLAATLPVLADSDDIKLPGFKLPAETISKELSPEEQKLLNQWRSEPEAMHSSLTNFRHEEPFDAQLHKEYQRAATAAVRPPAMVPEDVTHFKAVLAKAKKGDSNAQLELGALYDQGGGVTADHEEAFRWWMKAAEQGVAVAQNNVGAAYATGLGVPRDHQKSAEWYRKSADQGNPTAQAELGWMYFAGNGVPKDKAMAKELWLKAADDSPKAKFGLHVLANTRKLNGDGEDAITGCIMGISLDGTFPDQILYVGEDGVLCSQLKLADASKSIQEEYGYSPERAAAYHADRMARQRSASEARVKELEAVLRRLTALRRERQIDDLNDNLRTLTQTLDQRNGVVRPPSGGISNAELDQKIFDLQQSIDQMTEEPVVVVPK